ncbi:MAG: large subunit ribosomal protein L32 [Microgenomates group bacterium LiPW_16]|nr:MAG: large subunit ribosomal protein L32 [Microgenomates group bacterium LiPW_16]
MAPLPKRRLSTARSGKRRKALALSRVQLVKCQNCGQPKKPHLACPNCGQYNNRVILLKKKKEGGKQSE